MSGAAEMDWELDETQEAACARAADAALPILEGLPLKCLCEFTARLAAVAMNDQPWPDQAWTLGEQIATRAYLLSTHHNRVTEPSPAGADRQLEPKGIS